MQRAEYAGSTHKSFVMETRQMPATAEQMQELQAVLASKLFVRAPSQARLLQWLCEQVFQGQGEHLKEYTIGVEFFGRAADFNHKENAIVRVEARRLREKLKQYYEGEGAAHPLHIVIPVGQYVPLFQPQPNAESAPPECALAAEFTDVVEVASALPAPRRRPFQQRLAWIFVGGVGVILLGFLALRSRQFLPPTMASPPTANAVHALAPTPLASGMPETAELRIMAGSDVSKWIDRSGKLWVGDRYFTGGSAAKAAGRLIYRTYDQELYRASRQGDFTYDIPLAPGRYQLRLHFAETHFGPEEYNLGGETSRVFTIFVNGKQMLRNFDIFSEAGGGRIADVRVFNDITPGPDGLLHLKFASGLARQSLLNGIEVLPLPAGQPPALRFTMRQSVYFAKDGTEWLPDQYFLGGRVETRAKAAAGAQDQELYQAERYGNFSYAIPVAPGRYTVILHFAERYFGAANSGLAGLGGRLFHISCNGEALVRNLDIFKQAGGENKALVLKFPGLMPNAQGHLRLEFTPVKNYAMLNAVEVLPAAR
jgi:hypothetical protein